MLRLAVEGVGLREGRIGMEDVFGRGRCLLMQRLVVFQQLGREGRRAGGLSNGNREDDARRVLACTVVCGRKDADEEVSEGAGQDSVWWTVMMCGRMWNVGRVRNVRNVQPDVMEFGRK